MREIKFRVWVPFTRGGGRMLYDYGVEFKDGKLRRVEGYSPEDCGHMTVMQYTGIKDTNGKGLYEGDIIKHEDGTLSCVKWDSLQAKNIEIMGNKYEHSKLLEKK